MTFFDSTSTHMLSLIAAVYGVFVYTIAFSLEMFFIVTSPVTSSSSSSPLLPAYSQSSPASSLSSSPLPLTRSQRLYHHSESSSFADDGNSKDGSDGEPVPIFAFILAAVYFAVVMVSLLLILGIIIRSMICVSAWLIAILLLFFPEAALVFFITIYSWGVDSRNGQIELCFYVIRVILNIFFLICVQQLLSQWKTEKQASSFAYNLNSYNSYPPLTTSSPYIAACSTTVNPVFKFATLSGSQFDARTLSTAYESDDLNAIRYLQQDGGEQVLHKQEDPDYEVIGERRSSSDSGPQGRYSTQSLDRRKLKAGVGRETGNYQSKEEIILKPMSHRPFEYLHRPGSSADVRQEQDLSSVPYLSHLSHSQSFNHKPHIFSSRTLPRHFERISSIQSLRDVAL